MNHSPYYRLARADKPTGSLLLLFPCLWGVALGYNGHNLYTTGYIAVLFIIGSFVMRGAGCVWNDLMDADIDAQVMRTAARPIPSGELSTGQALVFLAMLLGVGLCVLVALSLFPLPLREGVRGRGILEYLIMITPHPSPPPQGGREFSVFILGISSLLLVAIYPITKRITYFPQLLLGLTFNWGALMGWVVMRGEINLPAITLYIAGIFWTLGYDTIYAHQDKEDDMIVGVKSTAIYFGVHTKPVITIFYSITIFMLALSGYLSELNTVYYLFLALPAIQFAYQIKTLDINNPTKCLQLFNANKWFGLLVLLVIIVEKIY